MGILKTRGKQSALLMVGADLLLGVLMVVRMLSVRSDPGDLHSLSAMHTLDSLATAYTCGSDHPVTDQELKALRKFIASQFNLVSCPVVYIDDDITLPECINCLQTEGVLYISVANNHHPYLTSKENAQFRAVHDFHHAILGADSTFAGEYATFEYAKSVAPKSIHWILFSEIVLQAAACLHTGEFQPQKMVKAGVF